MRTRNRLLAVGIVGMAVIAACIGTLTLSETEQQTMSYPGSASVGNVAVGSSATTTPIVFSPQTTTDDDTIMSISESCTKWTLNLNPLPARVNCDTIGTETAFGGAGYGSGSCVPNTYSFTATFTPSGPGPDSCLVTVTYKSNAIGTGSGVGTGGSGSGSGSTYAITIGLNGTGVAPAFSLTSTPASGSTLQYTDIPITMPSSTQRITLTNNGSSTLNITGTNSNATTFPTTGTLNPTLAMGQSANVDVACQPTAVQGYTGTITFTTPPGQGGLSRTFNLVCNGISSDLQITPNPVSFARNTLVGSPVTVSISLTNMGATTTLDSIQLQTGDEVHIMSAPTANTMLVNGASAQIILRYDAATERPFGRIDNLVISHTPGGTRTIAISAEALIGEVGISPALVNFGPICPGSEKTAAMMVYATSSGPVNLTSITQPGSPFSVTGAPGQLEPNHGNIIELTARVSATAAGDLSDMFMLNTNVPNDTMHEVMLEAVALPAGVTPTPNVVHFGPGRVATTTTAKHVTISNCGATPLRITGARIDGVSAVDFTIVGPEDPLQTIQTMGELEFLVVMNPQTTGTKVAKLVIEYEGGIVEADLDGNGFGADTGEGDEKGTYYTCSAGGAGGLPIAFALLLLRRRRRR